MVDTLSTDTILDIGEQLGLSRGKQHDLLQVVTQINETIQARRAAQASLLSRNEFNRVLKNTSGSLERLEKNLKLLDGRDGGLLSEIYARMLAQQLSNNGLEASLNRPLHWPAPSIHLLESREAESHVGPYEVLEHEHYGPVRATYARAHAPNVLSGLFHQLRSRLDAYRDLSRKHNRGGRKSRGDRDFTIETLARSFPTLFDQCPTSTPSGPFCTLCELVLSELGEGTDGLDTAVQRALKTINS
jgi:hypothetical protein